MIINDQSFKGEADLELLAEMDTNSLPPTFPRFEQRFLEHLQVHRLVAFLLPKLNDGYLLYNSNNKYALKRSFRCLGSRRPASFREGADQRHTGIAQVCCLHSYKLQQELFSFECTFMNFRFKRTFGDLEHFCVHSHLKHFFIPQPTSTHFLKRIAIYSYSY